MGWAAEGIDWALVQTKTHDIIARGLCELSQRYDVLVAFTSALQWPHNGDFRVCEGSKEKAALRGFAKNYCVLPRSVFHYLNPKSVSRVSLNGSNILMLVDEPPPTRDFGETRQLIGRMGLCSRCVFSHFHLPRETSAGEHVYTPPPYDPQLYAPYRVRAAERHKLFFVQKRSQHRSEVTRALRMAGYRTGTVFKWDVKAHIKAKWDGHCIQEASHTSQVQPYASYLRGFAACRWAIALDLSKSAGQVVAEAALLGVPIFSYANKANARLVLPPELLVSSELSPNATARAIARVVQTYEGERAYAALSAGLIRRAEAALRLRNSRERAAMLLQCC